MNKKNQKNILIIAVTLFLLSAAPVQANEANILELYRCAAQTDPSFLEAQASLAAAKEQLKQARSALLPTVDAKASLGVLDYKSETINLPSLTGGFRVNSGRESRSIELSQTLFNLPMRRRLDAAYMNVGKSFMEVGQARDDLMVRSTKAVLQLIKTSSDLQTTGVLAEVNQGTLRDLEKASKAGQSSILAVQEQQAHSDIFEANKTQAEAQLSNAQRNWSSMCPTLLPPDAMPSMNELGRFDFPSIDPLRPEMLGEATEVLGLRFARAVAYYQERANRGEALPQANFGVVRSVSTEVGSISSNRISQSIVGVNLVVPIFDGGLTPSKVRESRARIEQLDKRLLEARQRLEFEGSNLLESVDKSRAVIKRYHTALLSLQKAIDGMSRSVDAGLRPQRDLRELQENVADAMQKKAQAAISLIEFQTRYLVNTGRLQERDLLTHSYWLYGRPTDQISDEVNFPNGGYYSTVAWRNELSDLLTAISERGLHTPELRRFAGSNAKEPEYCQDCSQRYGFETLLMADRAGNMQNLFVANPLSGDSELPTLQLQITPAMH